MNRCIIILTDQFLIGGIHVDVILPSMNVQIQEILVEKNFFNFAVTKINFFLLI